MLHPSVDLAAGQIAHYSHARKQNYHEDKCYSRRKMQIIGDILTLDSVADKVELAAAELLRDVEGADSGYEHHRYAGYDTWHTQRKNDSADNRKVAAAEVTGCLKKFKVHLGHDGVDW